MVAYALSPDPSADGEPVAELMDEALALVGRVNERVRSSTDRFRNASRPRSDVATPAATDHDASGTPG